MSTMSNNILRQYIPKGPMKVGLDRKRVEITCQKNKTWSIFEPELSKRVSKMKKFNQSSVYVAVPKKHVKKRASRKR